MLRMIVKIAVKALISIKIVSGHKEIGVRENGRLRTIRNKNLSIPLYHSQESNQQIQTMKKKTHSIILKR